MAGRGGPGGPDARGGTDGAGFSRARNSSTPVPCSVCASLRAGAAGGTLGLEGLRAFA